MDKNNTLRRDKVAATTSPIGAAVEPTHLDTNSAPEFVDYYARASLSDATHERFEGIQRIVLGLASRSGLSRRGALDILDIGCGAGTQCLLWANRGHNVRGIDINESLIKIAKERAKAAGHAIQFQIGNAASLPFEASSVDVCLMPELLEHVVDWEGCVIESVRVLRSGGILFLSTTNLLCPRQYEFTLPIYSWYPALVKRHFERLASTTRPELVNHARYPAVHWFTYYGLARFLEARGMQCFDRFLTLDDKPRTYAKRLAERLLRKSWTLRFLGQLLTPGTIIFAIKADR